MYRLNQTRQTSAIWSVNAEQNAYTSKSPQIYTVPNVGIDLTDSYLS